MTIVADTSPIFPKCPGYGFRTDPYILVKIIELEGGFERADRKWSQARRTYDGTPIPDNALGDVEDILYFWLAVGGMAGEFRFKDLFDFKSCHTYQTPTPIDQPLQVVPGGFRLTKQYTFGPLTHTRPIRRPNGATVQIANQLGVLQPSSAYSLDEATGVVVPNGGFTGTPTAWGGEFYVWVRFNANFTPEIINREILSAEVSLIEKRERG